MERVRTMKKPVGSGSDHVSITIVLSCLAAAALLPSFAAAAGGEGSGNCTTRCGDINIEYPFGVEAGCYHPGFNLTCNRSSSYHSPRLFLGDGTVQVLDISVPNGTALINNSRIVFSSTNKQVVSTTWEVGSPYFLSGSNKIALVGCNARVDLRASRRRLISSCTAVCPSPSDAAAPSDSNSNSTDPIYFMGSGICVACSGVGCCQANISFADSSYSVEVQNLQEQGTKSIGPTDLVYIVQQDFTYHSDMAGDSSNAPQALPALLNWYISTDSSACRTPTNSTSASAPGCLSNNSFCQQGNDPAPAGYKCYCSPGYQGNPYIVGGCHDIDECKSPQLYSCYGDCNNTQGSHVCKCPHGYEGNPSTPNGCKDINECAYHEAYPCYGECVNLPGGFDCLCFDGTEGDPRKKGGCLPVKHYMSARVLGLRVGLGVGCATILLLLVAGAPFILRKMKLQKLKRMREMFFKQNHGLLLQRLMSQNVDIGERMVLGLEVLEKATDNFDKTREVGGGGHGVVYKGILDLKVVAVKKSRIIVQREINDFINEVAILSQVNHRNIVKLLGCCLETEVPLLVYEFISNGSLDHHLHIDGPISLSWDDRVRIVLEVARALSYLHSAVAIPIFHRDVKACNILLDDHLTAKVSDFGASRYIPIDQTEVTTAIQGTIGYLDPMYYYTGHLTDKSDVFSFGVLLIEVLTRKRPVYRTDQGESLISHFASLLRQGHLADIIDPQVMMEGDGEVQEVASLAAVCTKMDAEDRPTMREVEMALENVRVNMKKLASDGSKSSAIYESQGSASEHRTSATEDMIVEEVGDAVVV